MRELNALGTLIGGYLHEDWYLEYGDPWVAIERFVLWEPDYAPFVRADVDKLVARCRTDEEVVQVMDEFGLGYDATSAGWASYGTWLLAVADRVDQLLHTSPAA
jgi:hypothetical protein